MGLGAALPAIGVRRKALEPHASLLLDKNKMTEVFDTYGLREIELADCVAAISRIARVELLPHDSGYRGGEYFRAVGPGGEFVVQRNYIELTGTWVEEDHRHFRFILETRLADGADELRGLLAQAPEFSVWLRRVSIDGKTVTQTERIGSEG